MSIRTLLGRTLILLAAVLSISNLLSVASAGEVLVADRLTNSVFRYSDSGQLLGTLLTDSVNLNQPTGIAVSPDLSKLYVSSFQTASVVQYDYNYGAGTATNPTVIASGGAQGIANPNTIRFNADGSKFYVSNLGGTGVAQFNANGTSAGPNINGLVGGGAFFQFSGLAFAPTGELFVGAFQDFPAGTTGAIAKSDPAITSISDFITPSGSLLGASGLLVHDNFLYVASMFGANIQRFDVNTGALDNTFGINGLAFPQDLMLAPDGNGFLVTILGMNNGEGNVAQYQFDGQFVGIFAASGNGGFTEATALAHVPEPSSVILLATASAALCLVARRRMAGRRK